MPRRFITYSRHEPERTILGTIAWLSFIGGIFVMLPWYTPLLLGTPAVAVGFNTSFISAGIINCLLCVPALRAVKKNRHKDLAFGALTLFCWYFFIVCVRIITSGFFSLYWFTPFIVAGVLAVIYIEQNWLAKVLGGADE